jgi:hypothetical protein
MHRFAPPLLLGLSLGTLTRPVLAEGPAPAQAPPAPASTAVWQPQPLNAQSWARRPYTPILPSLNQRALPGTERHSSAAMVTGIVLVGLGVVGLGVGTAVGLASKRSCGDPGGDVITPDGTGTRGTTFVDCPAGPGSTAGMAILASSAVFAGIGIPLWIFGSERVSRYPDSAARLVRPTLLVGPGSAGLRFSF